MSVGNNKSMVSNRYGIPMYVKGSEAEWQYEMDLNSYGAGCRAGFTLSGVITEANAEAIRRLDNLIKLVGGVDRFANYQSMIKSESFKAQVSEVLNGSAK